jgi:hypothetical protein
MSEPIVTIHQVTAETFHLVQPLVQKWLQSKHCPHSAQEIISALERGAWSLWAVVAGRKVLGIYSVRVYTSAQGKFLEIPFLVGDKARQWWTLVDDAIDEIARGEGCDKVRIYGRKGWERVTRDRYRPSAVVIEREVRHGL